MSDFITVASAVPAVSIANVNANVEAILGLIHEADNDGVDIVVFPEMCVTGYTCGDLFHNDTLLKSAREGLLRIVDGTRGVKMLVTVGYPLLYNGTLYNTAAVMYDGVLLGFVPKSYLPNYNEFYEKRWWASAPSTTVDIEGYGEKAVPMGVMLLFEHCGVKVGIEICEDLWTPIPPSCHASLAGAEVILNLSASDALIGKYKYLTQLVQQQSARCQGGYVYASAGFGESSTDLVFDGITLISDRGVMLASGHRWHNDGFLTVGQIDIAAIRHERMQVGSFHDVAVHTGDEIKYAVVPTRQMSVRHDSPIFRDIDPRPFVPYGAVDVARRCDEIINIQTAGLAQRLKATCTKNIVVGISGGLDSTLALLVAVKTFDRLGLDRKGIHGITMPGFGTTDRTHDNAVALMKSLGVSRREISIVPAVNQHFADIGHDASNHDVTYENSQARQRTLLLMDIANQVGGMVLGTGDLSELALGWATYNGDHMSMYGVNAGVPKTLVRYLVERFADGDARLIEVAPGSGVSDILHDIVDTPISPELIPADSQGNITQKTEDLVGPYELHDFFLYYMLRYGLSPRQIFVRARKAFEGAYDTDVILKWLRTFVRRFFAQQFKRSCMPDGPKVGSVCLSPRGDWRMPSDATSALWLTEADALIAEHSAKTSE